MPRATFLVFLTSALVLFTTKADEHDVLGEGRQAMSVHSRSFQQLSAQATARSNLQPEERHKFSGDSQEQRTSSSDSETNGLSAEAQHDQYLSSLITNRLAAVVDSENAVTQQVEMLARSEMAMSAIAEARDGMAKLQEHSKSLRAAVEELGLEFGLDESAQLHDEKQKEAKAVLREVASENANVHSMADELEHRLQSIEARVLHPEPQDAEDKQFEQLEAQTKHIMDWFQQLKELKEKRDAMKAKKNEAMRAAKMLGITPEEIENELVKAGVKPDAVAKNLQDKTAPEGKKSGEEAQKSTPEGQKSGAATPGEIGQQALQELVKAGATPGQ